MKLPMTYRSILLPVGAAALFGGLLFMKSFGDEQMNVFFDTMPQPPVTVSATEVTRERWPQVIEAVGTFVAVNGADLATETDGIVTAIGFVNGTAVKQGQVILTLDTAVDRAELQALEATGRLAATELERFQRLYESKSVSKADLDTRQSQADQARANLAAQRARNAQKTITAPFDGVLGIRRVNLGQYVEPGTAIVTLQSLDPIFLNFTLPEQRLADISVGLPVTVQADALPGRGFQGKITAIEPEIDRATRNFMAQASFENPDHGLRPGMFAKVQLQHGAPRDVLVVPQTAISFNPYGNSVYVIRAGEAPAQTGQTGEANAQASAGESQPPAPQVAEASPLLTVKQRFVRTGTQRGDLIEVIDGLAAGERVVTSGLLKLRNDAVVAINNEVEPEADATPSPPNS